MINLTPKREWIELRDLTETDAAFSYRENREADSISEDRKRRSIDFNDFFKISEKDSFETGLFFSQSQQNARNEKAVMRSIFSFSTCGKYADLLAGLSLFAKQTDYIVKLDQLIRIDKRDELQICGDIPEKRWQAMQVQLSVYPLSALHSYIVQTELDRGGTGRTAIGLGVPFTTQAIQRFLSLSPHGHLMAWLTSGDFDESSTLTNNNFTASQTPKYLFLEKIEKEGTRGDKNSDDVHARIFWKIGTKYKGRLLVGIVRFHNSVKARHAIIQNGEGLFITISENALGHGYQFHSEGIIIESGTNH